MNMSNTKKNVEYNNIIINFSDSNSLNLLQFYLLYRNFVFIFFITTINYLRK